LASGGPPMEGGRPPGAATGLHLKILLLPKEHLVAECFLFARLSGPFTARPRQRTSRRSRPTPRHRRPYAHISLPLCPPSPPNEPEVFARWRSTTAPGLPAPRRIRTSRVFFFFGLQPESARDIPEFGSVFCSAASAPTVDPTVHRPSAFEDVFVTRGPRPPVPGPGLGTSRSPYQDIAPAPRLGGSPGAPPPRLSFGVWNSALRLLAECPRGCKAGLR